MSTLKKINLSIALLITTMFFVTTNCSAQQRQGQGQPPMPDETQINKMVEDLSAELSLTEDQETEVLALYQDHFAEVKSSMSSGERPNREKMESFK